MSNFSDVMDYLGLSPDEAAKVLKTSPDEIVRWRNTDDSPPLHVWQGVVQMLDDVRRSAEEAAKSADLDLLEAADLNRITLIVPPGSNSEFPGPKRAATALAIATIARVFV